MKILELCLSRGVGGLELYVVKCCRALSEGDEVVAVVSGGGMIKERIDPLPVSVVTFNTRFRKLPLVAAYRLAQFIDRESIDMIHMHWNKDLPLAAFAKWFSKRRPRLVISRHMKMTRTKQDIYHRFLYGQMDRMLSVTRALAEIAKKSLPIEDVHKSDYLYLGVQEPAPLLDGEEINRRRADLKIDPENFVIGAIGRIEPYKGQHLLIEAASQLKREGYSVHLLLIGHAMDSDYLASLKERVVKEGMMADVHFHEFVDNPQQWMQLCDAIALTTIEETFGLVLVEAMRTGIAVVGSDRGGVLEIITPNKTGLLFTSGSSDSLAEQLRQLMDNRELCEKLAVTGKQYADIHFDEAEHFSKLRQIFTEVMVESV